MFSIANRRTVITAATAGIDLAVAAHFVSPGADGAITGRRAETAIAQRDVTADRCGDGDDLAVEATPVGSSRLASSVIWW